MEGNSAVTRHPVTKVTWAEGRFGTIPGCLSVVISERSEEAGIRDAAVDGLPAVVPQAKTPAAKRQGLKVGTGKYPVLEGDLC